MATVENNVLLEQATELEEILELMPNDIGTLNSLVYTYLQLGDEEQAAEYAMDIRTALTASGDLEQLSSLASTYLELAPDNLVFKDLAGGASKEEKTNKISLPEPMAATPTPIIQSSSQLLEPVEESSFDMGVPDVSLNELCMQLNYELDLGELLKKDGIITEVICEQAVENLIQHSGSSVAITMTLLAELANLEHVNMEKIYGVLSSKTNMPFIKPSQFDIPEDLIGKVELKTAKRLGIIIFSKFGNEFMVACLNPLDEMLRETLESYLGTKLHFYLTSVAEVDKFYDKALT